jgi:rare lipoprotein A
MRCLQITPFLALTLLAGCGQLPLPEAGDAAPTYVPADLHSRPEPVPSNEPPSRRGNPASYEVFGRTYRVMPAAAGYAETGVASWYGTKFHGRDTSSGEPFDMYAFTAAHRTLPIPTFVRVTNLDNGRKLVVRVNDRGPFHGARIIDLSYGAAVRLGYADQGTARVHVEVIEQARPYFLQAGAFRQLQSADALKASLAALTGAPTYVVQMTEDPPYRVRLGPLSGRAEAERLRRVIMDANHHPPMILGN